MADDRIDVVFGAEFSDLVTAVQQIKNEVQSLAGPAKSLGEEFIQAGTQMRQGAQSGASAWMDTANFIEGNALNVLDEVLLGTTTWQKATAKLFADLALSLAQSIAEMVADWAAFQALGIGSGIGSGSSSGGLLGLAAGFLGGGGGSAAGGLTDLAMFQAGAWSIPRDMIALVHAGEMILPANAAATARAGGAVPGFPGGFNAGGQGAGANFALNVSVQAMDAAGVAQWANANARTLAQTITRYMGNNPSTRGA
jgi:hypothetical protein